MEQESELKLGPDETFRVENWMVFLVKTSVVTPVVAARSIATGDHENTDENHPHGSC